MMKQAGGLSGFHLISGSLPLADYLKLNDRFSQRFYNFRKYCLWLCSCLMKLLCQAKDLCDSCYETVVSISFNSFHGICTYQYSVLPIYRGIEYIVVACWTPLFATQERDIFSEIAVTPWTQFAGDNFSRNLLTTIAFVHGPRETIFRETNSSLPANAGWNTCFMRWSATPGGVLTSPLCRWVGSS